MVDVTRIRCEPPTMVICEAGPRSKILRLEEWACLPGATSLANKNGISAAFRSRVPTRQPPTSTTTAHSTAAQQHNSTDDTQHTPTPTAALSRASLSADMPQSSDSSPSKQSTPTPLSDLGMPDIILDGLSHTAAGCATYPGDSLERVHRNMYDLSLRVVAGKERGGTEHGGAGRGEGRGGVWAGRAEER